MWGKLSYVERFLDLLHIANHEPMSITVGNNLVALDTGQIVVKSGALSKRWGVDKSTVKRFISFLLDNNLCAPLNAPLNAPLRILNFDGFNETEAYFLDSLKMDAPHPAPLHAPHPIYYTLYIKRKKKSKPKEKRKVAQEKNTVSSFKTWGPDELKNSMREANETTRLSPEDLHSFYDYWTEPSASGKPRYQRENTWATLGRLRTWSRNLINFTK